MSGLVLSVQIFAADNVQDLTCEEQYQEHVERCVVGGGACMIQPRGLPDAECLGIEAICLVNAEDEYYQCTDKQAANSVN